MDPITPTANTPPDAAAEAEKQRIRQAYIRADAKLAARQAANEQAARDLAAGADRRSEKGLLAKYVDVKKSEFGGMAAAVFETKDFLVGEPAEADKSGIRKSIEGMTKDLNNESPINAITSSINQFAVGLIGAGKVLAPVKLLQGGAKAKAGFEIARGALAGGVVIDPHEERLSDLIETYPSLRNPVTAYLKSDSRDTDAEGRLKNALEGIGLDFAVAGILGAAAKGLKLLRMGETEKAAEQFADLEQYRATSRSGTLSLTDQRTAPGGAVETPPAATAPDGTAVPINPERTPSAAPGVKGVDSEAAAHPSQASPESPGAKSTTPPPFEVTPETVAAALKGTDDDLKAIAQYGSREAANEAGAVLAKGRLPWQKLTGPEEVQTFLDNAAAALKGQMDEAKGGAILTDAAVSARVQEIAKHFGDDPLLVLGQISEAGAGAASMVSKMDAAYLLSNAMGQDAYGTATRIRNGLLDDWGGDAAKAAEALRAQVKAAMNLMANAKAISSNSGRALRRMRGGFKLTPEDLAKVDSLDATQLADLLYATRGDPKLLAKTVNPGFFRRAINEGTFLLQNNLLWLHPTHIMNLTSSALMIAGRPTEKLLGSFAVGGQSGNFIRKQAIKEYAYTVGALGDGWTVMVDAFMRGDSILSPHNTEFFQAGAATVTQKPIKWKPTRNLMDLVENGFAAANYRNLIGLPTRSLGAADEFFKTLRYRAVVQAEAAMQAETRGLTGQPFRDYVAEAMEKAIDPATGQALNQRALLEAQTATFQQELFPGSVGATIQQVRSRHPLLHFVLPFVKTPINVLRYGQKMTPGLNLLQREFRDALMGANGTEAQAQAVGQMALGGIFMGLAATMALDGKITGPGPSRPDLKQQLTATGWQPFSYVLEDEDGGKRFIPMGRADPVGMVFAMTATLVEAMRNDPDDTDEDQELGIAALGYALAKNFTDRTFLANLNQAVQALSEPGRRGEKWLANTASNLIPFSSAVRGYANQDPYLREANGFIETLLKSMPGYSETLPPVRDVFGEPVARRIGLTSDEESDIVEAEHNRIILETGKGIGKPSFAFEGLDLRDVTFTEGPNAGRNAYDRLQELSAKLPPHGPFARPSLKATLTKIIKSAGYQDRADGDSDVKGTRLFVLARAVQEYREAAKRAFLQENKELQPMVKARQRDARGAFLVNRAKRGEGQPGARELLDALGATK
ncbi:hypothetical protein WHT83_02575 [Aminobacter sp. P9b]|uniref:hypothetical protein n=1 Tax=Aminobacter sp. P9b TaxID=3133697 RepID=UPI0032477D28